MSKTKEFTFGVTWQGYGTTIIDTTADFHIGAG
jgi:hypothetical protein